LYRLTTGRLELALLSLISLILLTGPAAHAAEVSEDVWGIHKIWGKKDLDGLPFLRGGYITPEWQDINPQPGVYDFSIFDTELKRYHDLGKSVTIAIRGSYKPAYLYNEVPWHPVQQSLQVKNDEGTLAYWHPNFQQRFRELLEAFAEYLRQSPYRSTVYSIRGNINALGTEHSGIESQYQAQGQWTVPAGVDWVPYTESRDEEYKAFASELYLNVFTPDFLVLVRSVLLTGDEPNVSPAILAAIRDGRMGLFHTSSVPEPYSRSTERKYDVHMEYGRNGKTLIYAEPFSYSEKGSRGEQPPAQWNYWRILGDLHVGVTFISVYGSDIELHTDPEIAASFSFGNRYAGYQTGSNPVRSPGAWVAFRGGGEYMSGDYTFLMSRMSGDSNTELEDVGPDWQRQGAWARRIPANGRMRFQLDDRFASAIQDREVIVRIHYFDSRSPRFGVRTSAGDSRSFRGGASGTWKTVEFPIDSGSFATGSGADITLTTETQLTVHMVELVRADAGQDDNANTRPNAPTGVR